MFCYKNFVSSGSNGMGTGAFQIKNAAPQIFQTINLLIRIQVELGRKKVPCIFVYDFPFLSKNLKYLLQSVIGFLFKKMALYKFLHWLAKLVTAANLSVRATLFSISCVQLFWNKIDTINNKFKSTIFGCLIS